MDKVALTPGGLLRLMAPTPPTADVLTADSEGAVVVKEEDEDADEEEEQALEAELEKVLVVVTRPELQVELMADAV